MSSQLASLLGHWPRQAFSKVGGWVIKKENVAEKSAKEKEEKTKDLSKLIVWIWLGLSQGLSLPIPALRRLDEHLTELVCSKPKQGDGRSQV